ANVDVALFENPIFGEQFLQIVADLQERVAKRPDVLEELRWQILMHATDAEIVRMHAGTRGALIESHQLLAFLESPERRGERTDIQRLRGHVEEVGQQSPDLAIENANELRALGELQAEQLLSRQAECMLLVHGRDVVEPVEIGKRLQIRLMFDQFLGPAMQETDMRI